MDEETTIESLKVLARDFVAEREWAQFHNPKNLSMALAGEAAELMEHFLWCGGGESFELVEKSKNAVGEELADIIIYALHFANRSGIDVSEVIHRKMKINAAKYPVEKSKGRSDKYDQL
ncbi:nucleotide pyrophosphohydrolase [Puniceicoccaceae bacterium K14]|nr:nucleotide pyrophosphohydrolase [Puniceicoccaceae bacterium K14]